MSVRKLVHSKNLFINTDDAPDGNGVKARFNLPQGVMDCQTNQTMVVTLASFNMRVGFYRINQYNNVFYILSHDSTQADKIKATRVQLETGDYTSFFSPEVIANQAANWQPGGIASQTTTLDVQLKYALLNSTTSEITYSNGQYTAENAPPDFLGPTAQTIRTTASAQQAAGTDLVLTSAAGLTVGDAVSGVGIPANTTIAQINSNTITLNNSTSQPIGSGAQITITISFRPSDITTSFDPLKGTISFQLKKTLTAPTLKAVGFYVKDFNAKGSDPNIYKMVIQTATGTNPRDLFQSSFEIVGGCAEIRDVPSGSTVTEQFNSLRDLFTKRSLPNNDLLFDGQYKATLQSEECIYLRTNLQANNYQTLGFDTGIQTTPEVQPSSILAKIPLNNPFFAVTNGTAEIKADGTSTENITFFQQPYEFLNYTDNGNNLYSLHLNTPHVSNLEIFITDSYGRLVPFQSVEQGLCRALSFSCDLRIDTFEEVITQVVPADVRV